MKFKLGLFFCIFLIVVACGESSKEAKKTEEEQLMETPVKKEDATVEAPEQKEPMPVEELKTINVEAEVADYEHNLEIKEIYAELLIEVDASRHWHAPQIRFGQNTLYAFGRPSSHAMTLKNEDIYIIDIGPVFNGVEADYAITISTAPQYDALVATAKEIWNATHQAWIDHNYNGMDLYFYAQKQAQESGYILDFSEGGHRIGPFPHERSAPSDLKYLDTEVVDGEWILEIKLIDPIHKVGAFFEAPLLK